ncbi:hypothetical protein F5144DRAFT_589540 [Chaetomium tenue]|uniref:Uncharacterized protein n=1 Tax=Chaetomium tenue TaxID=1854479 RepID=A0ACB7PQW1_9PEZI|nr:hypothetical protein F5144DRAFT_589540 [Chaetomium globosum]
MPGEVSSERSCFVTWGHYPDEGVEVDERFDVSVTLTITVEDGDPAEFLPLQASLPLWRGARDVSYSLLQDRESSYHPGIDTTEAEVKMCDGGFFYKVELYWKDCYIIDPGESYYFTFNLERHSGSDLKKRKQPGETFSCVLNPFPEK